MREGVRFKKLRLLVDNLKSFKNGWLMRFSSRQLVDFDKKLWQPYFSFHTNIKWRPELGEDNMNRIKNMEKCASAVHGLLIKNGACFSLRKRIGDPIQKNGFASGPMLINGELSRSSGGGICQVSTTLFNLALLSDLEILEKHHHSTDIWGENRFIDLGRDAAFVYALKDLKFKNTSGQDLILDMQVDFENKKLAVTFYAKNTKDIDTEVKSVILDSWTGDNIKTNGWLVKTERKDRSGNVNYSAEEYYRPVYKK